MSAISLEILKVDTPTSTPYWGWVDPIPNLWVFGINTRLFGAMSTTVEIPPDLIDVNPINLGVESMGSSTGFPLVIVIVAIPIPLETYPVAITDGPTKFNWVIDPAVPTTVPSSLTVIPWAKTEGGTGIQYLWAYPSIAIGIYCGPMGIFKSPGGWPKLGSASARLKKSYLSAGSLDWGVVFTLLLKYLAILGFHYPPE